MVEETPSLCLEPSSRLSRLWRLNSLCPVPPSSLGRRCDMEEGPHDGSGPRSAKWPQRIQSLGREVGARLLDTARPWSLGTLGEASPVGPEDLCAACCNCLLSSSHQDISGPRAQGPGPNGLRVTKIGVLTLHCLPPSYRRQMAPASEESQSPGVSGIKQQTKQLVWWPH